MKMKFTLNSVIKFILLGLVALGCSIANAGSTNFYCSGVVKGKGISDSPYDFDLLVDSNTGYMSGFPVGLYLGCFQLEKNSEKINPMKCSIDDIEAICTCQNYGFSRKFTLSRRSAVMIVDSLFDASNEPIENNITRGRFTCQKLKNKTF